MNYSLVLASASPQRARLLHQLGLEFTVAPADIDETPRLDESPEALALRLAETKARVRADDCPDALVLGSDTVVALGQQVFGKPRDLADARRMLTALGGKVHRVATAVTLFSGGGRDSRVVISEVTLDALDEAAITAYWQTGEPAGAAGAYAIQGHAAQFIAHLSGSYSAVMGLPLHETAELLRAAGLDPLHLSGHDRLPA